MPTQLTPTAAKARSDRAQARQIYYNQSATDPHGQNDGTWRADCSGLTCAVFDLPGGINCYSTSELVHKDGVTGAAYDDRRRARPYGTVTMVTAEDGSPFGHVAIVIRYDASTDRLQIQEHGGGTGPDIRWLPSGVNYDSDQKYGRHRNFRLYDLVNVTAGAVQVPPSAPSRPTTSHGTAFPFPGGVIGLKTDPSNDVHGGINAREQQIVAAVQRVVGVRPDGNFGTQTLAAVQRWQRAHHTPLPQSGNIGPATWAAMGL